MICLRALMAIFRMSELVRKVAIVGHQDQPFAFQVQAAHRVDMLWDIHQIADCLAVIAAFGFDGR